MGKGKIVAVIIGITLVIIIVGLLLKSHASICSESWTCSTWGTCNGTQTRACTDANNCGTFISKPNLTQHCAFCEGECCAGQRKCYDSKRYQTCMASNSWSGLLTCPNSCSGEGICA